MVAPLAVAATIVVTAAHGVSARVPEGWRVLDGRLTSCTNPIERLDVAGPGGALVMLQEALDRAYVSRFPRKSAHVAVRGRPSYLSCCGAPGSRKGWVLPFRAGGRSFYAYVYPGREGRLAEALSILDSLRVART
jgi:hypothetical protein